MMTTWTAVLAAPPAVSIDAPRHVYIPGETVTLTLSAPGATAVDVHVGGWLPRRLAVHDGVATYRFEARLLRPGDYTVQARAAGQGQQAGQDDATPWAEPAATFTLSIGLPHDPDRLPVWRWGHLHAGMDMDWFRARGFTGATLGATTHPLPGPHAGTVRVLEEAARHDFAVGAYLHPLYAKDLKDRPELHSLLPNGQRVTKDPYPVYPLEPATAAYVDEVAASWITHHAHYPALRHALLSSEYRSRPGVNPAALALARQDTGLDFAQHVTPIGWLAPIPKGHVRDGLIDDDDPHRVIRQWWYSRGDGVAITNQRMGAMLRQRRPDVLLWHDPWRKAPIRGTHPDMDMIGSWTYPHPDPKTLAYTTYLHAAARPAGQKVQQNITLFLYGHFVMPLAQSTADYGEDFAGSDPYFTAGPDLARFATWLSLSQRPDALTYYWASRLPPEDPRLDPALTAPETFDAIGQLANTLIQPYGPTILRSQRHPARVALLASATANWFSASPRLPGNDNEQTLPYAMLLMMTHTPFDVLLDDDLVAGMLDGYDTLVLPKADTLTRGMHQAITRFIQRGGRVIADPSLRAALPGAIDTGFDMSFLNQLDGRRVAKGEGITLAQARTRLDAMADKLAGWLDGSPRPAWANTREALTHTLVGGEARYHFFINDRWAAGPRFGQAGLHHELGVRLPMRASVTMQNRTALYDVMRRQLIKPDLQDGVATFDLTLPAAGGKLIAALPEPIAPPVVATPEALHRGQPATIHVTLQGRSGQPMRGVLPIHVQLIDPLGRVAAGSRHLATDTQGQASLAFDIALNEQPGTWQVRVTENIGGQVTQRDITCR